MVKNQAKTKKSNLRDVAAAAGVSVATVSRVVNSPESVSDATRERVESAMASLRWVPSAAARAINSGRTRFVGALVPTLDHDIFARMLAGIETELAQHDLSLVVATTQEDPLIEAEKAKALVNIGAEGLIVSGLVHDDAFYKTVDLSDLPVIATSSFDPTFRLPTIGYDNAGAAQTALSHLHALGHRNIAVVHGPRHNNDRTRGRLAGVDRFGQGVHLTILEAEISVGGGADAIQTILQAPEPVTAVLSFSDVIASGMLFELQRLGKSVPQDLSLVSIDDLPGSAHLYPALTTVHLPVYKMGQAAAYGLAQWLETKTVPEARLLDFELVVRQSAQPLK